MKKDFLQEFDWRTIEEYEDYMVSSEGHIASFKGREPRLMKPYLNGRGYKQVRLYNNGKSRQLLVHRLVAAAFIENECGDADQVNHKNGIKHDNRVKNLEWVSAEENMRHAHETGLMNTTRCRKKRRKNSEPNYLRYGGAYVYKAYNDKEEHLLVGTNDIEAHLDSSIPTIKKAMEIGETINGYTVVKIGTVKEVYKEERIEHEFVY